MKNTLKLLLFLFVNLIFIQTQGQFGGRIHEQLRFKYISIDDGLPSNLVRGMTQDQYGYIWIGTRLGISRFDGYSVTNYTKYYNDSTFLDIASTREFFLDSKNTLWAGCANGLFYFDWDKNMFIEFKHPDLSSRIQECRGIDEDSKGNIWFGSRKGLVKYNPKQNSLTIFEQKENDPHSPPIGIFQKIMVNKDDHIWYILEKDGAGYYNPKTDVFNHFIPDDSESSLAELKTERLYEDTEGNIWIGHNNKGVSKFSYETNSFQRYFLEPGRKESGRVRGITEDTKGNFWFGTQAGLYLFDKYTETFKRYAYSEHPISTLSHNSVQTMFIDRQDGLWLGTFAGGVSYTSLNTSGIVLYEYSKIPSNYYLNDKNVYSLAYDNDGNIWVGTENGGLNYLNRKNGFFTYYTVAEKPEDGPLSNNIKDFCVDKNNNVWFGTYRGGLSMLNTSTGKFKHYLKTKENPNGLPEKSVYKIQIDPLDTNLLWIAGIDHLYIFDIVANTFIRVEPSMYQYANAPEIGRVSDVFSHNNKVYFTSDNFILVADCETKEMSTIESFGGKSFRHLTFVFVDRKNQLWAGINKGQLGKLDIKLKTSEVIDTTRGLPEFDYLEGTDDEEGNLWLSSNRGLWKLEGLVNNTDTFKVTRYDKSNNVQSLEFLYNSIAVANDGEILMGGINGFNSFYPSNVKPNPYKSKALINKLEIAGKEVLPGQKIFGKVILEKSITETKNLRFHHRIKLFKFGFAGLHYVSPENNKFKYILEGFDKDWHYVGSSHRFATYSNIPRGKYTFKVDASNNNGVWSEEPAEIKLKVTPPFWKTIWFFLIILLLILGIIRIFISWREKQLKVDKEKLEEQLRKGQEEIEANKQQVAQQAEELKQRDTAEHETRWHNKGIISIGDIISQNKDSVEKLGSNFISNLTEYLETQQGAVYVVNTEDETNKNFELIASYALSNKVGRKKIGISEGLLGVCYKDKKTLIVEDIPEGYTKIDSGLGSVSPKVLVLVPLIIDENVIGIVEIASLKKFEQFKITFIETIATTFGSNLYTLRTNSKVSELLDKSRLQAEELKEQEEEMRQNMEEMQATQEEAERREEELNKIAKEKDNKIKELAELIKAKEAEIDKVHELIEAKEKEIEALKENLGQ